MAEVKPPAKVEVGNGPQPKQEAPNTPFQGGRGGRGGGPRRFGGPGRDFRGLGQQRNTPANMTTPGNRGPQNKPATPGKVKAETSTPNRGAMRRGGFRGGLNRDAPRGQDDRLNDKLSAVAGPTHDLPPLNLAEKKFSGRNRLYIGNLTNDVTEEEIQNLFKKFGETSELFINKEKCFAFIRLDFKVNAEKAKNELDGVNHKGRALKIRFAPNSTALRVKNLSQWATNELLEKAFAVFGDVERAVVSTDERGKSTGEGVVEFARKPGALMALRRCTEGCYFLTSSLRPVILEPIELIDDTEGFTEKNIPKKNPDYYKEREVGPRFAPPDSFEYDYGTRWKQLFERKKQKEEALKREMKLEEEKLEAQMEYARYEHETEMLREQLRQREMDRDRQKRDWEMKERQAEEQRRQDEEMHIRQQERIIQEEEMRRRQQEGPIFMPDEAMVQRGYDAPPVGNSPRRDFETAAAVGGVIPPDPKAFMDTFDRGGRYDSPRGDMMDELANGQNRNMGGRSRWGPHVPDRPRVDDYQAKRRRF